MSLENPEVTTGYVPPEHLQDYLVGFVLDCAQRAAAQGFVGTDAIAQRVIAEAHERATLNDNMKRAMAQYDLSAYAVEAMLDAILTAPRTEQYPTDADGNMAMGDMVPAEHLNLTTKSSDMVDERHPSVRMQKAVVEMNLWDGGRPPGDELNPLERVQLEQGMASFLKSLAQAPADPIEGQLPVMQGTTSIYDVPRNGHGHTLSKSFGHTADDERQAMLAVIDAYDDAEELIKAGGFKYKSKKRGANGKWMYDYGHGYGQGHSRVKPPLKRYKGKPKPSAAKTEDSVVAQAIAEASPGEMYPLRPGSPGGGARVSAGDAQVIALTQFRDGGNRSKGIEMLTNMGMSEADATTATHAAMMTYAEEVNASLAERKAKLQADKPAAIQETKAHFAEGTSVSEQMKAERALRDKGYSFDEAVDMATKARREVVREAASTAAQDAVTSAASMDVFERAMDVAGKAGTAGSIKALSDFRQDLNLKVDAALATVKNGDLSGAKAAAVMLAGNAAQLGNRVLQMPQYKKELAQKLQSAVNSARDRLQKEAQFIAKEQAKEPVNRAATVKPAFAPQVAEKPAAKDPKKSGSGVERAKLLRSELKKKLGLNSKQVSVRSDHSSINITVKVPGMLKKVDALANEYKTVSKDQFGDILGGGNTFVFTELSDKVVAPVVADIAPKIKAMKDGDYLKLDNGYDVRRVNEYEFEVYAPEGVDRIHTPALDASHTAYVIARSAVS